jgi:hypothetical protein
MPLWLAPICSRGTRLALTGDAFPGTSRLPAFQEEDAMNVALASLVVASLSGLPDKPVDFTRPPAALAVDQLWVHAEPRRPTVLPWFYGTYVTLQALDVWTTTRSVAAGAREVNPAVGPFSKNYLALTAMKAATTSATIYFADRLWRRNRAGAIVVMAVLNGVSAAVVIHNHRVAQRAEVRR